MAVSRVNGGNGGRVVWWAPSLAIATSGTEILPLLLEGRPTLVADEQVVLLGLLLRVLGELLLHRLAGESGRAHRVELVTEHAHDLGGHRVVQEGDGVLYIAPVVLGDRAGGQMLPGPAANLLDVGKKRSWGFHGLALLYPSIG